MLTCRTTTDFKPNHSCELWLEVMHSTFWKTHSFYEPKQQSLLLSLLLLDTLAISFLLPLLPSLYRTAEIPPSSLELLSAVYSFTQVVGGVLIGLLTDAGYMPMRSTLLLSFLGSAVSYGLLGTTKSITIILLSRALVGLVKQTSTVTTALLTELTKDDEQARVKAFSTMGAITQFGWFVGPSIGSFLFRRIGFPGVAFISSMMFVVAYVMAFLFLSQSTKTAATAATATRQSLRKREVFSSVNSVLGPIILVLLYSFCQRATSSSSLHNYYESRYNIDSSGERANEAKRSEAERKAAA